VGDGGGIGEGDGCGDGGKVVGEEGAREWRGQIEIGAWTDQSKTVSWADYALGGLCVGGLKKMPWTDFAVGKFCIS
jgi:hypothetical protein